MARGRKKKNMTLEEELLALSEEMTRCEEKIKELTSRKKELKQLIEKKQMEALYKATVESGKSIEEAISLIHENKEGSPQPESTPVSQEIRREY